MNNFYNEITATLMILLQQSFNQEIFIEADEKIFVRKKVTESGVLFYPITTEHKKETLTPILNLNENRLFSISEVLKASKTVQNRLFSGVQALEMRINTPQTSEKIPDKSESLPTKKQEINQTKSELRAEKKRVETLRYYGLEQFHNKYTDNRWSLILELEKITCLLLLDGSENVKKWAKQNFIDAQKVANTDIDQLTTLLKKATNKRRQQVAALRTNETKKVKRKFSDKIKIFLTVAAVGVALIFAVVISLKKKHSGTYETQKTEQTKVYTDVEIITLIDNYEITNNCKIYEWRRSQIIAVFEKQNLSENRAIFIIDSVANYKYKNNYTPPKTTVYSNINEYKQDYKGGVFFSEEIAAENEKNKWK